MDRLQALIRYYRVRHRPRIDEEERWFAAQPSLAAAIHAAALATDWRGKRLPHANRFPATKLKKAEAALLAVEANIAASQSFAELHRTVCAALGNVWQDAELFSYDTALRIGAKLGLAPDHVYLHRGTRTGARKLGLNTRAGTITVQELPASLHGLEPREAEDFLCIFKHKL